MPAAIVESELSSVGVGDASAAASADVASSKLAQPQQLASIPQVECDVAAAPSVIPAAVAASVEPLQSLHEEKPLPLEQAVSIVASSTEIPPSSPPSLPSSAVSSSTAAPATNRMMDDDSQQGVSFSSSSGSASSATSLLQLQRGTQLQPRSSTSPMLSESDDEMDFSTSASECSSNSHIKGNAASSSSSSSTSSVYYAFSAALASPLPPSPADFSIAMACFPPRCSSSQVEISISESEEAASQGRAVEIDPIVTLTGLSESTVIASSATAGNATATRSSEQQEREEQERRDHAYALELQALLQPESVAAAVAVAVPAAGASPSPASHTAARYPAPRADGEYEHTAAPGPAAEDWRLRYAKDLELGTQLSNHSGWQQRVQGFAAAGAAHFQHADDEQDEEENSTNTTATEPASSSSSDSASGSGSGSASASAAASADPKVPVAPALLPSGIARGLISQSQEQQRAARALAREGAHQFSYQSYQQQQQQQQQRGRGGARYGQQNLDSSDPDSPYYVAPKPVVMVTCGICLEEAPESATCVFGQQYGADGFVIQGKKGQCSHAFCKECQLQHRAHSTHAACAACTAFDHVLLLTPPLCSLFACACVVRYHGVLEPRDHGWSSFEVALPRSQRQCGGPQSLLVRGAGVLGGPDGGQGHARQVPALPAAQARRLLQILP